MTTLKLRIENARQAVSNLTAAIEDLKADGADTVTLAPYLTNLAREKSTLEHLLRRQK